jgi:drug/metabolite transporter (DMT)-like permease
VILLSWIAAFVACLCYGVASVLQSIGAQRVGSGGGLSSVGTIIAQLPYLIGLAADGVAFLANVLALQRLPLFLVQSIMTASVAVTAVIAAIRGARLGSRDWLFLGVLGLGLILLCITAVSEDAVAISRTAQWVLFGCGLVVPLGVGGTAFALRGRASWLLLAGAAGLAWTGVALASRGISVDPLSWHLVRNPLLWAILIQGALGVGLFAYALQRGPVTPITAITFVLEMIVPSSVGLLLFGDDVQPGLGWLAIAGFLMAIGGTLALARYSEVPATT